MIAFFRPTPGTLTSPYPSPRTHPGRVFQYALAVTSISPSVTRAPAFLAASTVAPTTHAVVLGPSSPRSRLPVLALTRPSDDSKPNESRFIQTKSLRAPRGTTVAPEGCAHLGVPFEFTQDQGLLCLERTIPDEISQSLGRLVEEVAPFKVEVFRGSLGANGRWLDTLIQPFLAGSSSGSFVGEPSRQHSRTRVKRNGPSPDLYSELADDIDVAVRWLTADIDSVARLFAREVANSSTPWPGLTVAAKEGGEIDLTVKLELLKKGKCPRYHLDRVRPGIPYTADLFPRAQANINTSWGLPNIEKHYFVPVPFFFKPVWAACTTTAELLWV